FSSQPAGTRVSRPNQKNIQAVDSVLERHPDSLYVVAAGNDGTNVDDDVVLPCGADAPNLICVGSFLPSGKITPASNYGSETVDLLAPGQGIRTTFPGGTYGIDVGTSMATAYVSGVAALLFAEAPGITPEQVKALILASLKPVDDFRLKTIGGGVLNALG